MMLSKKNLLLKLLLNDNFTTSESKKWYCWEAKSHESNKVWVITMNLNAAEHALLKDLLASCDYLLNDYPVSHEPSILKPNKVLFFNDINFTKKSLNHNMPTCKKEQWIALPSVESILYNAEVKRQVWAVLREYVLHISNISVNLDQNIREDNNA